MNPLYNSIGGQKNNMNNLLKEFQKFRSQFNGNPQEQIQQLLNSGKITQEQYDRAVAQANQFRSMLGM